MNRKYIAAISIAALLSLSVAGLQTTSAQSPSASTFKVTVTNLTPGQPLTPPLIVAHDKGPVIFEVGTEASPELAQLAENGNAALLAEMLEGTVYDVVQGDEVILPANDPAGTGHPPTQEFMVQVPGRTGYISYASMLVCTNDGFAGISNMRLPLVERTVYAKAYDARTEANTEDFADLVPPCQAAIGVASDDEGTGESMPATAETGIVIPHPGVFGTSDLVPSVHGWDGPVAKIKIERMG